MLLQIVLVFQHRRNRLDTLFVKYETSGTNNTSVKFTAGETLNCTIDSAAGTATVNTCHTGSSAYVGEGVYYINGFHVNVSEQVIVLDKYTNSHLIELVYQLQNHL